VIRKNSLMKQGRAGVPDEPFDLAPGYSRGNGPEPVEGLTRRVRSTKVQTRKAIGIMEWF